MKMCLFTGNSMRSRSGRFSSKRPPTTPGRALTMYFEISIWLFPQNSFNPLYNIRWLIDHLFRQTFQPFARDRIDLPLPFVCVRYELRIFQHLYISLAKSPDTIGGNTRCCQDRSAKGARAQDYTC